MTIAELRAILRLGRRMVRRDWRRSVLITLLIALPVLAAVVTAGLLRVSDVGVGQQARAYLGSADLRVMVAGPRTDQVAAANTAVDRLLGDVSASRRIAYRELWAPVDAVLDTPDGVGDVMLTDRPLDDGLTAGITVMTGGRPARGDDEVVISDALLRRLDAHVGDDITLAGIPRSTIVGTLVDPVDTTGQQVATTAAAYDRIAAAFDAPIRLGDLSDADTHVWLLGGVDDPVDTAAGLDRRLRQRIDRDAVETEATARRTYLRDLAAHAGGRQQRLLPAILSTLVAGLLLAETALVAGAAIATGTRRRLRLMGLLGANGATIGHLRLVMLSEAAVTGALGAVLGIVIGLVSLALAPLFAQRFVAPLITGIELSPVDVAGPAVAGVVAALVAAWLPTRAAARVPIVTALHARVPLAAPRWWVTPLGLTLGASGAVGLAVGIGATSRLHVATAILGVLGIIGGIALLTVPIVAAGAKVAHRLPVTLRLVARDAARQRTRAAAGCAAAVVVLALPVLSSTALRTEEAQSLVHGLPGAGDQALVRPGFGDGARTAARVTAYRATLDRVAELLPAARRVDVAVLAGRARVPSRPRVGELTTLRRPTSTMSVATATPALLAALASDPVSAAIADGHAVVLGIGERDTQATIRTGGGTLVHLPAREVPLAVASALPRLLLPPARVADLRLETRTTVALFQLAEPMNDAVARQLWSLSRNGTMVLADPGPSPAGLMLRWGPTLGALVVAIVIMLIVALLSATESDRDLRTMTAIGAPPRMRRRFLGLQAGSYTLVGAILGTALAAVVVWTFARAGVGTRVVIGVFGAVRPSAVAVDWAMVATVLVAIPLLTGLVVAGSARSSPTLPPRARR